MKTPQYSKLFLLWLLIIQTGFGEEAITAVLFYATKQLLNQKRLLEEKITPSISGYVIYNGVSHFFIFIREWYINYVLWFPCNWHFSFVKLTIFKLGNFNIQKTNGKAKNKCLTFRMTLNRFLHCIPKGVCLLPNLLFGRVVNLSLVWYCCFNSHKYFTIIFVPNKPSIVITEKNFYSRAVQFVFNLYFLSSDDKKWVSHLSLVDLNVQQVCHCNFKNTYWLEAGRVCSSFE